MYEQMAPTFRTTQANSHVHAWQTAQWAFTNADLYNAQWVSTLDKVERDGIPFLEGLKEAGHEMTIGIVPYDSGPGGEIETYEVVVKMRAKDGDKEHALPGKAGTDPGVYDQAVTAAASDLDVDPEVLREGHFALYAMVQMMTALNACNHIIESRAFAIMVIQKKIEQGEKADYLDINRPAKESLQDFDYAMRVVANERARIARARAEVLALTAISSSYDEDAAIDLLREQVRDAKQRASQWRATHTRPTMDQFGVRVATLPTPDQMIEDLKDRAGFAGAVLQVAKGVATGSPSATLEGIARMAPADSSARVALDGLAAAASGDVVGATSAIVELGGGQAEVDDIRSRVEQLASAAK